MWLIYNEVIRVDPNLIWLLSLSEEEFRQQAKRDIGHLYSETESWAYGDSVRRPPSTH
jgi:hypothetical protein